MTPVDLLVRYPPARQNNNNNNSNNNTNNNNPRTALFRAVLSFLEKTFATHSFGRALTLSSPSSSSSIAKNNSNNSSGSGESQPESSDSGFWSFLNNQTTEIIPPLNYLLMNEGEAAEERGGGGGGGGGVLEEIELLLEYGADLSIPTRDRWPLQLASSNLLTQRVLWQHIQQRLRPCLLSALPSVAEDLISVILSYYTFTDTAREYVMGQNGFGELVLVRRTSSIASLDGIFSEPDESQSAAW
jgi:hypothetical protein